MVWARLITFHLRGDLSNAPSLSHSSSWVRLEFSSAISQATNLAYVGIGSAIKDALTARSDSRRLSTSGPDTLVNSANAVERRTSLATDFSTGAKGAEPSCQLLNNVGQQIVTDYYFLVPGADKGTKDLQREAALGTEAYTLPSGTGPGTTGKPDLSTDRKHIPGIAQVCQFI